MGANVYSGEEVSTFLWEGQRLLWRECVHTLMGPTSTRERRFHTLMGGPTSARKRRCPHPYRSQSLLGGGGFHILMEGPASTRERRCSHPYGG